MVRSYQRKKAKLNEEQIASLAYVRLQPPHEAHH
jgi:hypothetical protein